MVLSIQLERAATVLCLGAHADDIEIGCGGALLTLLKARPDVTVHWHVFSGAGERRAEAESAAESFLQAARRREVCVHDFADTLFPAQWREIKAVFDTLRAIRPDLIFTHRLKDRHQDHRTVAELTWCTFRDQLILEYEIPKYEGDLRDPNLYVPLSDASCARKVTTIMESFVSQRGKPWFRPETFFALMALRGVEAGRDLRYAEAFHAAKVSLALGGPLPPGGAGDS